MLHSPGFRLKSSFNKQIMFNRYLVENMTVLLFNLCQTLLKTSKGDLFLQNFLDQTNFLRPTDM